jgi:hypothetical protein
MIAQNIWLRFILAALVTWRLTHLVVAEDGPLDVISGIRRRLGGGFFGKLMDCFYCLSLWVAAPCALVLTRNFVEWPIAWLGLSGMACLLERVGSDSVFTYSQPRGANDNVLRSEPRES